MSVPNSFDSFYDSGNNDDGSFDSDHIFESKINQSVYLPQRQWHQYFPQSVINIMEQRNRYQLDNLEALMPPHPLPPALAPFASESTSQAALMLEFVSWVASGVALSIISEENQETLIAAAKRAISRFEWGRVVFGPAFLVSLVQSEEGEPDRALNFNPIDRIDMQGITRDQFVKQVRFLTLLYMAGPTLTSGLTATEDDPESDNYSFLPYTPSYFGPEPAIVYMELPGFDSPDGVVFSRN